MYIHKPYNTFYGNNHSKSKSKRKEAKKVIKKNVMRQAYLFIFIKENDLELEYLG